MKTLRLYPPVKVQGQDFSREKIETIPNQNLTLKDIIARFIRKESLPIGREGIYNEDLGDLEKVANEDIVDRKERAADIRAKIDRARKKAKESPSGGSPPPAAAPPVPTPTPPQPAPTAPTPQGA